MINIFPFFEDEAAFQIGTQMNMDASILEDAPIISLKMRKPHYAKPTGAPAVEAASHITGNNTISGSDFPKIFNAIDQDVEAKFKRHFWSQTRCETKFCGIDFGANCFHAKSNFMVKDEGKLKLNSKFERFLNFGFCERFRDFGTRLKT